MTHIEVEPLGRVAVAESEVYVFPGGLPGFNHLRRFALIQPPAYAPLAWMAALDQPGLSFVVANPVSFFPSYRPRLAPEDLEVLALGSPAEALIVTILTVPQDPQLTTANLRGPVVLNPVTRLGRQAILAGQDYSTKQLLAEAGGATAAPNHRQQGSSAISQGGRDNLARSNPQAQPEYHHR